VSAFWKNIENYNRKMNAMLNESKKDLLALAVVDEKGFHVVARVTRSGEIERGLEAKDDEFASAIAYFNTYNLEEKIRDASKVHD